MRRYILPKGSPKLLFKLRCLVFRIHGGKSKNQEGRIKNQGLNKASGFLIMIFEV